MNALTEVTLPGPAANGRPPPTLLVPRAGSVSAKADTWHEAQDEWSVSADLPDNAPVNRVGEGRHLAQSAQKGRFESAQNDYTKNSGLSQ
jgi:hypothetical protein